MDESEFIDDYEVMYEAEMEIARELEMDFEEGNAASCTLKNPVKPTIPTVKRNLFSEDLENCSLVANGNNSQSLANNDLSSLLKKANSSKKPRIEKNFDEYLDDYLVDDWLTNSPQHKKQKLDKSEDEKLIDKILSFRQEAEKCKPENLINLNKSSTDNRSWGCKNLHKHIPSGEFVSVTTGEGKRFYLDVITEDKFDKIVKKFSTSGSTTQLLEEPYSLLKVKAQNELLKMKSNEERYALNYISHTLVDSADRETLWVDKYRPNHYLDLLSDEGTNKTVLRWLKLWDKVVFGRDFLAKKNEQQRKNKDTKPNFFNKSAPDVIEKLDEMGIPEQKVILLCGPPGLGKTTLAHVIACQAGYNVLEMNASDDRSTDIFKKNIENATSMKAVMGAERKPNCLVIDEIDGAPTASINLLVNLLQGKRGNEPKKGKKEAKILKRPIICICNDLYTTSLRALRQMALIIRFMPTQSARLVTRLNIISQKQQLKADISVLRALCNKTENDIRSCLSVLQFIKASSGHLKFSDLEGVSVGQKDYQRSLFTGWQEIFTIPPAKKKVIRNVREQIELPVKDAKTTAPSRFSRLLKVISSCGEYDKLMLGWFENYPLTKFKHTYLEPVIDGLEWATTSDILQVEIHQSQSWILMKYIPYAFVAYHLLFATHQRPKLLFPMQFSEHLTKQTKCKGVINAMVSEMLPYTRYFSDSSKLIYDFIPYLLVITQPHLRPVNIHLYNQSEKETFSQIVNSMISYNLTYLQDRSPDGQYSFCLDPNIEDVSHYAGMPRGKPLSYSCRQLVAREIEMEKVRRADSYFIGGSKDKANLPVSAPAKKPPSKVTAPAEPMKKISDIKPVSKEAQVSRDFFGRRIEVVASETKQAENSLLVSDIWFKFKEGYSNAVRRTIKLKDLLT